MNGLSKAMTMKSAIVVIALAVLATGLATSAVDPVTVHAQPVQPEVGPILVAQPNVPTGLKLIWQDERVRLVTWDSVPSADSYNLSLCYGTTNTPSNCQVSTAYASTSIYVFDVEHVAVQAVNSSGVSAWSQYVIVAKQPPATPTDIRVINSRIGWDSSNGAESYGVELCRQSACDVIDNIACCTYTPSNLTSIEYVRVRAVNGAGRSDWSDATYVQTIVPLPNAPSGVSINSGRVTWNSVSGAEWYNIILDRRDGGSVISNIPCCSYTLLPSNTSDATHVSIQAANSTSASPYSAKVSIPAALQKPPTPSSVRFESGRVIWNAVSGAASYWVSLCTQLGCVVEVDRSCCSYTVRDRNLEDLTHVRVAAVNSAGQSAWSSDAPVPRTIGRPDAPSGVTFSAGRASWNPVANADSYELLLCVTHGGAPQCPQQPRASCCSYTISDRSITHFLVRAVNSAGDGHWSDPVYLPVQTPGTPTSARLRDSGQMTWNSVSGADSYDVALCTSSGCVVYDNISCCRYTPSDLRDVTHIKVRAVNSAGRGDWSRSVDVKSDPPDAVRNLEFRYLDPDTSAPTKEPTRRFEITWDPPSGQASVSGYVVTLSRPAVRHHAAWSKSYNHSSNSFRRRHTGQAGTVYTVTVAAKNQHGTGEIVVLRIGTDTPEELDLSQIPRLGPVQDLAVTLVDDGKPLTIDTTFKLTWEPPQGVDDTSIREYKLIISRPHVSSDISALSRISIHRTNRRVHLHEGIADTTFSVIVQAVDKFGRSGVAATTRIQTPQSWLCALVDQMRPTPSVSVVASGDWTLLARWSVLRNNCDTKFEVNISRDGGRYYGRSCPRTKCAIDPWSMRLTNYRISGDAQHEQPVSYNAYYRFCVTAIWRSGPSKPGCAEAYALAKPSIKVIDDDRFAWLANDAVVEWDSIREATKYALDWRYMEIDTDRLRQVYREMTDPDTSNRRRQELANEADVILLGKEVDANRIDGPSSPRVDPNSPEGYLSVTSPNTCEIITRNEKSTECDEWDPENPSYRIRSRNQDHVLQVRVRPIHGTTGLGPWSDWAYIPASKFVIGCRALDFYEDIKKLLTALNIAGWFVTIAGIATAAFTGGGSTLLTAAAKEALKAIVKRIVKDTTLKRALKELVKTALKETATSTAKNLLGFVFGCATHGLDLSEDESRELGWEIIQSAWDDIRDWNWNLEAVKQLFDLPG